MGGAVVTLLAGTGTLLIAYGTYRRNDLSFCAGAILIVLSFACAMLTILTPACMQPGLTRAEYVEACK